MTRSFRAASPDGLSSMTTRAHAHEPERRALRALLTLLGVVVVFVAAGPAAAATPCGKKVIDDWYDGRIDGTYPLHCYDDAIDQLPGDLEVYSSAPEDITRALQARLRNEKPPANDTPPPTNADEQDEQDEQDEETSTTATPVPKGDDGLPPGSAASENASSVPLPLLLLAGLALLLVAGGVAGYVVRRVQARRVTPPAL
jgi:hypothetical protein